MGPVPLEKLLDKAEGSIYKLVILASRRALEVAEGAPKLRPADDSEKATVVALMEIADGKVWYKKPKKSK